MEDSHMKKLFAAAAAVAVLAGPVVAMAGEGAGHEHMHMDQAKAGMAPADKSTANATITGEILDTACYFSHGAMGAKHAACAAKCIQGGAPMAVLTPKGEVILLVANHDNEDPYNAAKGMAAKNVAVTGTLVVKGGMKTMIVDKVEPKAADKKS
jgi:hypothetical protein